MKRFLTAMLLTAALAAVPLTVMAQTALNPGTIEGTLDNDTATFTLDAAEGDIFLIAAFSEDFDTIVRINDAEGSTISSDDDGGPDTNSQAIFVAPADGTYTVELAAFGGSATGAYTLTLVSGATDLTIGETASASIDGLAPAVFRFEAPDGAFNIVADSGGTVDTSMRLVASFGFTVESSEDTANGVDPALTPVVLSDDVYYIVLTPVDASAVGDVTLSVKEAEALTLGTEPTVFTFGANSRENVATFDVVEGSLYEIAVTLSAPGDFSINLEAEDTSQFTFGSFSFNTGIGGTFLYRADVNGTLLATVSSGYGSNDEPVDYTITVTPVQE